MHLRNLCLPRAEWQVVNALLDHVAAVGLALALPWVALVVEPSDHTYF